MTQSQAAPPSRIGSVDSARGYPMLILILVPPLLELLRLYPSAGLFRFIRFQMSHAEWHGLHYIDIGFPAFLCAVGLAIPLALGKRLARGESRARIHGRLVVRSLVIFALGLYCNMQSDPSWPQVRVAGVLQRIAICYLVCSLLYLHLGARARLAALVVNLAGYWALLAWVPVPGFGAGDFSPEGNLAFWVDRMWLPGKALMEQGWDPEGILSTLGALANCQVGMIVIEWLRRTKRPPLSRVWILIAAGLVGVCAGYAWSIVLPLNKWMWTPSYALLCSGAILLHFAPVYLIDDVWKRSWLLPLTVVGANPLLAYLGSQIGLFRALATRLLGGDVQQLLGPLGPPALAAGEVAIALLILWALYRNRVLIKI